MRMSRDEKTRSHGRIVASASRLLRERGLEGASVAEVMQDAGMTHGGFYKHFASKDALAAEALESAFAEFVGMLQGGDAEETFAALRALYLSPEHMLQPGRGCPAAALGPEIARGSVGLKATFGAGVRRMAEAIARPGRGSAAVRRAAALRELSMLVGAMIIARASDPALAQEVLDACGGGRPHAD